MITIEFLRQFRLGEYAVFDFTLSFLGIYLLSPLLSKMFRKFNVDIPRRSWMFLALPIGIFAHLLTGNTTPMTKNFIDLHGNYHLKILIIGLSIFGVKGVKKTS